MEIIYASVLIVSVTVSYFIGKTSGEINENIKQQENKLKEAFEESQKKFNDTMFEIKVKLIILEFMENLEKNKKSK